MGKKRKNKAVERVCGNCKLFNSQCGECSVVVLHEGERLHLPVSAKDPCFFEGEFFSAKTNTVENFAEDLKEVKFWVEDKKGEKTAGNGTVKMEYPEGFFGDLDVSDFAGLDS